MSLLQAILMGIIQGATEFLPVSSSGHLAIFKNIFGVKTDTGILFDILLHFGTLVAIFIVYWADIKKLVIEGLKIVGDCCVNLVNFIKNKTSKEGQIYPYRKIVCTAYRKFVMLILVSTLTTTVIAVPFDKAIGHAGDTLLIPGICLCITSVILYFACLLYTSPSPRD